MRIAATCTKCGSDQIALEIRDWFGDDPLPPPEGIGTWFVCTKCGYSWQDWGDTIWS